jgi:hypothetical protein
LTEKEGTIFFFCQEQKQTVMILGVAPLFLLAYRRQILIIRRWTQPAQGKWVNATNQVLRVDNRCPHCLTELSGRSVVTKLPAKGIRAGAPFSCPHCRAGLIYNAHPREGRFPGGLSAEFTVLILALVSLLVSQLISSLVKPGIAFVYVMLIVTVPVVLHQLHLYKKVLSSWPRYRILQAPSRSFGTSTTASDNKK